MAFTTKKYTRPVLVSEVRKLSADAFLNASTLAAALSPRTGRQSAKFAALKKLVNLNKVFNATSVKTAKQTLLSYLQS